MLKEHVGSIDFKVKGFVLILVLMEHAPRDLLPLALISLWASLNPYFNGTCSKSWARQDVPSSLKVLILILMEHAQRELGITYWQVTGDIVLILILMEHAQRVYVFQIHHRIWGVLILILMEHAQRERWNRSKFGASVCLNPYFNGTCSKRYSPLSKTRRTIMS